MPPASSPRTPRRRCRSRPRPTRQPARDPTSVRWVHLHHEPTGHESRLRYRPRNSFRHGLRRRKPERLRRPRQWRETCPAGLGSGTDSLLGGWTVTWSTAAPATVHHDDEVGRPPTDPASRPFSSGVTYTVCETPGWGRRGSQPLPGAHRPRAPTASFRSGYTFTATSAVAGRSPERISATSPRSLQADADSATRARRASDMQLATCTGKVGGGYVFNSGTTPDGKPVHSASGRVTGSSLRHRRRWSRRSTGRTTDGGTEQDHGRVHGCVPVQPEQA